MLEACGIDSNRYTGYALGMGVETDYNLKYSVSDTEALFGERPKVPAAITSAR